MSNPIRDRIINSPYLFPLLLQYKETEDPEIAEILKDWGITPEEILPMISLMEYHFKMAQEMFKRTQPNEHYPLLRKGLKEYFDVNFKDFWDKLGIRGLENHVLLDYGCGEGYYGRSFRQFNPKSKVHFIDKHLNVDFEKKPYWYRFEPFNNINPDFILLSEILHCKDLEGQKYLLNSSLDMLQTGNKKTLIIHENIDKYMDFRIRYIKDKKESFLVNSGDIIKLLKEVVQERGEKWGNWEYHLSSTNHYIITYHHE